MKKRILFFSLMLLIVSAVMAQKQWTLQECLDYAMANNITLKKQQLRQQTAMEELKGAKGALLPSVTASTNQSLGYQPWKDSGISTVTNGVVNTKVDKSYYNGCPALFPDTLPHRECEGEREDARDQQEERGERSGDGECGEDVKS